MTRFIGEETEGLDEALTRLDEREQQIIKLRYGLEDGHPRSVEDVARVCNITPERLQQIEIKALEKLKHPNRKEELEHLRRLLLGEGDERRSTKTAKKSEGL